MPASRAATGGATRRGPSAASSGSLPQRWRRSARTRVARARSCTTGAAVMRVWSESLVSLVLHVTRAHGHGAHQAKREPTMIARDSHSLSEPIVLHLPLYDIGLGNA